jgi:YggT family protein
LNIFIDFIALIVRLLYFAIFMRAIVSWFPIDQNNSLIRSLDSLTEPIIEPIRKILPTFGMLDLSPLVAIILLSSIVRVLESANF